MLFESWTLDITDYCYFNKLAFWQSKLLRLSNENLAVSSINHCLTDSPSTVETTTQHISLDPKMSNRPFSFDSKVQAEEPVVMGLFSKAAEAAHRRRLCTAALVRMSLWMGCVGSAGIGTQ